MRIGESTPVSVRAAIGWLLLASTAGAPAGAVMRAGGEFQVNSYSIGRQRTPLVATDNDGDFVVVWTSLEQDGQSWGVFAQRFASSGARLGQEFLVNSYTQTFQQYAAVAADADGDFVIAWTSYRQDGLSRGLFARRYASSGALLGAEFQVSVLTVTNQSTPAITMKDNGDFVVVWQGSKVLTGGAYNVYGRLFASDGTPTSGELQISTYTATNQVAPAIAADAEGDFVVAWTGSAGQDGFATGVFMRRFSSAGGPVGTEFRVNTYTPNYQLGSSAAMDDDGDFVVAWTSYGQDGSSTGAFARRFSSTGAPGSEFRLNAPTAGDQRDPKLTMDGFGRLVVAWNAENKDGFEYAVVARQFSRTGASIGGEFVVNTATLYNQLEAAVAIDASGDFVVAWTSSRQDAFEPGDTGIFAQRFVVPALDVDGDGTAEPLTDGLLVLRHLFGFQGASLIAGAVDVVECTRCTAPSIEQYLTAIAPQLDIDGDGELTPLTDGLLVERWLFGFNGATLISNAVDLSDCTRCTSQAISTYLTPLGP